MYFLFLLFQGLAFLISSGLSGRFLMISITCSFVAGLHLMAYTLTISAWTVIITLFFSLLYCTLFQRPSVLIVCIVFHHSKGKIWNGKGGSFFHFSCLYHDLGLSSFSYYVRPNGIDFRFSLFVTLDSVTNKKNWR